MAYDPQDPNQQDPNAEESQYASLLAPAAPVAPVAAHKTATPGFVNTERYQKANQGTISRMQDERQSVYRNLQGEANNALNSATSGLVADAQKNTVQGPASGTTVGYKPAPTTTAGVQAAALDKMGKPQVVNGRPVMPPARATVTPAPAAPIEDPSTRAAHLANYKGPTVSDVNSKFGALMDKYGVAPDPGPMNAFDSALLGKGPGNPYAGLDFDAARKQAQDAVQGAADTSGKAKSAWQALFDQFDGKQQDLQDQATANRADLAKREGKAKWHTEDGARPKGEDYAKFALKAASRGGVYRGDMVPQVAALFDRLSDEDAQKLVAFNPRSPGELGEFLKTYADKYGVPY